MSKTIVRVGLLDDSQSGLVFMAELTEMIFDQLGIPEDDRKISQADARGTAKDIAASGKYDLLLIDLMWPTGKDDREGRYGLDLSQIAKDARSETVVVVITSKDDSEQNFRSDAKARKADLAFSWSEAYLDAQTMTANEIAQRMSTRLHGGANVRPGDGVPQILESRQEVVGIVALDTVAYSEEDDSTQFRIVEQFLGRAGDSWRLSSGLDVSPICLFTGDGMILGITGPPGPRLALQIGIDVARQIRKLARFETKIAVHAGPATVIRMSDGAWQMVGHSINWACRAMGAASENGLVVTQEYYQSVLQGGREKVPGVTFTEQKSTAKHKRPLVVFDVDDV